MKLEITRKLTARSGRVYCVDWHPTEPWLLSAVASGYVNINNYQTHAQIKKFKVCDLPVRTAKFVARKNWVVTGSDDMQIRVFNYNTREGVHSFKAHSGYIRCILVHPTQPYIITCSDDMLIKLWNWDHNWACQRVFEGHTHDVMQIVINPRDTNTFASASLDTTIMVWQLGSSYYDFTLEGHEKGVNCVDYYHGKDQPFIISGADDSIKIWNYQKKTCVQTIDDCSQNVSAISLHPKLPILFTGSENGIVCLWDTTTFSPTFTLKHGSESIWTISCMHGSNIVAIGFGEGTIALKLQLEQPPAISMDVKGGKIIWVKHSEIQETKLRSLLPEGTEIKDGDCIPITGEDVESCEIYPNSIAHNTNGQLVVLCNKQEYFIYSATTWHSITSGPAQGFVWALDDSMYATLERFENFSTVKVFKDFEECGSSSSSPGVEGIFGGALLGVQFSGRSKFCFYDWEHLEIVYRFSIAPQHVSWSESGGLVCLATHESYFLLKYNADVVARALETHAVPLIKSIEGAFELVNEVNETVMTGVWASDCFIYIDSFNCIKYNVGGAVITISQSTDTMNILGYVGQENRLYLNDKELNIVSYSLQRSVLVYQTAVMRGDFETADRVLPTVPHENLNRVAHFLEEQGFKQRALEVSTEPEHQFELALSLGELRHAMQFAYRCETVDDGPSGSATARWSRLGTAALIARDYELTKICYLRAQNYKSLLLFAALSGNKALLRDVAQMSFVAGNYIVAFAAHFLRRDHGSCLQLLIGTNKLAEAAYFARSFIPSKMNEVAKLLRKTANFKNCSESVGDEHQYRYYVPQHGEALAFAKFLRQMGYLYQLLRHLSAGPSSSVDLAHEMEVLRLNDER